ncbi:SWIM zinc finger family protein [Phytohabitans flavus]|uniref:SWIM-type domain-containing protein n=1 Tax=Phytohabitans flavus TaxID=1076124 RepID=A0A6F8XRT4_9ACTN|nr:SWIM zinc finger family protein [Phytohabitans flavus]BCB76530.1 hypothetical protein Pflav_029400 [Phytohabitans flavus]
MAVRIDVEAFRESLPPAVAQAAERLREDGGLGELDPVDGGVRASSLTPDGVVRTWVGIVDGDFTGRCTCPDAGEDLCAHAAALVVAAVAEGIHLSADATPPTTRTAPSSRRRYGGSRPSNWPTWW